MSVSDQRPHRSHATPASHLESGVPEARAKSYRSAPRKEMLAADGESQSNGATSHQRIDAPHPLQNQLSVLAHPRVNLETDTKADSALTESAADEKRLHPDVSQNHIDDLISELHTQLREIDARESQLNAKLALHDIDQRNFRNWRNSQLAALAEKVRDLERRERELKASAQRIAAAEWANEHP